MCKPQRLGILSDFGHFVVVYRLGKGGNQWPWNGHFTAGLASGKLTVFTFPDRQIRMRPIGAWLRHVPVVRPKQ
jgi:hypothetical protein